MTSRCPPSSSSTPARVPRPRRTMPSWSRGHDCVSDRRGRAGEPASRHGQRGGVRLRLPTYFCAPNFAFLMVADAYDAVSAMPGVRTAEIVLEDHFASEAINGGGAARGGFADSFDGGAVGELDELRADFLRKAVMAGTDQVCRPLLAAGTDPASLPALTLGEVPPSRALQRLRERRAELGLPASDDAPLLIDPKSGEPVSPDSLRLHLGRARLTRTSLEANGSICRGMLRHRYDSPGLRSEPRGEEKEQ